MRVSATARDILLVPEPGTAWRYFHTTMISPMGRQCTLKGLATRNPTLLFSFVGPLLLRLDARRLLNKSPRAAHATSRTFSRGMPHPLSAAQHRCPQAPTVGMAHMADP
jgi:hypothetical protein